MKVKGTLAALVNVFFSIVFGYLAAEAANLVDRVVMGPGEANVWDVAACAALAYTCFVVGVATLVAAFQRKEIQDLMFARTICWLVAIPALLNGVLMFAFGMGAGMGSAAGTWEVRASIIAGVATIFAGLLVLLLEQHLDGKTRMKSWKWRY